ncbi:MAG: Spy/CpxP family protein refolding chaperone [Acidobacteria bacterium]|nr:Spy/CpxP family protein refolding chaperone [Acidobacteriota bacterium]
MATGLALAQGPGGPGGMNPQPRGQRSLDFLATYLNLTDSQKSQVQAIFDAEQQAAQALRTSIQQAQEALRQASQDNKSDAEIDKLAAALGTLLGQGAGIHAKAQAKFVALLTADQKDKLSKLPGPGGFGGPMFGPRGPRGPRN